MGISEANSIRNFRNSDIKTLSLNLERVRNSFSNYGLKLSATKIYPKYMYDV